MKLGYVMTEDEYETLQGVLTDTKMDCWAHVRGGENGDFIYDIEEGKNISLAEGLEQIIEGAEGCVPDRDIEVLEAILYNCKGVEQK